MRGFTRHTLLPPSLSPSSRRSRAHPSPLSPHAAMPVVSLLAPLPRSAVVAVLVPCRPRRPRAVPTPLPHRAILAIACLVDSQGLEAAGRRTKLTPPGAPPSQDAPHQPVAVIDWPLEALHRVKPGSSHRRAEFRPPPSTSADGENLPVTLSLFSLYSPTCPSPLPTESQATSPSRAARHGRSPKLFHSSP